MGVPFHGLWVWLRNRSGRNNGTSIFEDRPFGRLTGGHWTGYGIWVLLIPAAILILFDTTPGGWVVGVVPIVVGILIGLYLARTSRMPESHVGVDRARRNWIPADGHLRVYGGHMTSPVGILIIAAMLWIVAARLPEAVWFLLAAMAMGAVIGLVLWLWHR